MEFALMKTFKDVKDARDKSMAESPEEDDFMYGMS